MQSKTVEELEEPNYADGDFDVTVWKDELMQMKADDISDETARPDKDWQK